ncbi:MAG: type II toxin-antitoxin system RelE/ParE family toxin [Firmicutes bacterium]|nr:type II toxin-antitoxin system RelE/ParE family toxin [Bacillota bacterium]
MKYTIKYSNGAESDLDKVFDYIAADNLPRAVTFIAEIEAVVQNLLLFPLMGRQLDEKPQQRRLIYGNYKIIYEIKESKKEIRIMHVKNCAQSEKKYL